MILTSWDIQVLPGHLEIVSLPEIEHIVDGSKNPKANHRLDVKTPVNNGISLPYQLVSLPDFLKHQQKPPKNCWLEDYYPGTWEKTLPKVPIGVSPSVLDGIQPVGRIMVDLHSGNLT